MADVVPFPSQPSTAYLVGRVRTALAESVIEFDHPHLKKRMRERDLQMRHVLECLRVGDLVDDPKRDKYSDWRIKFRRYIAGRRVQVVVAVKMRRVVVVTVT
jgi:Domain of unknown function (DUF4258)